MQREPNFEMWLGGVFGLLALMLSGVACQRAAEGLDALGYWFGAASMAMVGVFARWCGCTMQMDEAEVQKRHAASKEGDTANLLRDQDTTVH